MTILWNWYGLPNVAPKIVNWNPTGSEEVPTVTISFSARDDRGNVVQSSIDVTITRDPYGTPVVAQAIINGVFQAGYSGTIVANAFNGFDVTISSHPAFPDALYRVDVYIEDDEQLSGTKYWEFTVAFTPKILSVIPSYLGLRIIFTKHMTNNVALRNPAYYDTRHYEVGAFSTEVLEVIPEVGVVYPEYVDCVCTDLTHGKDYKLTITPGVIQDEDGNYMTALGGGNQAMYHGVSEMPIVLSVRPVSLYSVEVVFSKDMEVTSGLLNHARYVFTNGLMALGVERLSEYVVLVRTSQQSPSRVYELSIL